MIITNIIEKHIMAKHSVGDFCVATQVLPNNQKYLDLPRDFYDRSVIM